MRSAFEATGLYPYHPRRVIAKIKSEQDAADQELKAQFSQLTPIDPFNLPATPHTERVLDDIAEVGLRSDVETAVSLEQLQALLRTTINAAKRAIAERNMYLNDLQREREKDRP